MSLGGLVSLCSQHRPSAQWQSNRRGCCNAPVMVPPHLLFDFMMMQECRCYNACLPWVSVQKTGSAGTAAAQLPADGLPLSTPASPQLSAADLQGHSVSSACRVSKVCLDCAVIRDLKRLKYPLASYESCTHTCLAQKRHRCSCRHGDSAAANRPHTHLLVYV